MGDENAEQKKGSCYPDKREDKIAEFPESRLIEGPDRKEVNEKAEAQPE